MFAKLVRVAGPLGLLLAVSAPPAAGATPQEIERSIKAGTDALKAKYRNGIGGTPGAVDYSVGSACLAGLAMLEGGVPANDPAVKTITDAIRSTSYHQTSTYHVSLCLMFLDRLGDPADVVRIQMLAMRLLTGQTSTGGWGYSCCQAPSADDVRWLQAIKPDQGAGKLHPDIERYGQALAAARGAAGAGGFTGDDNSNTQFGVMATWMARKHGAPVEGALELIEKRFMATQNLQTGNWPYSPGVAGGVAHTTPSMYCAGLLGMSTAVARREEKRKGEGPKAEPKTKAKVEPEKPNDPFYNPPAPKVEPKKEAPKITDARDMVVQRAFQGLGATMAEQIRNGNGILLGGQATAGHGRFDLYFLWSLERACVIYGIEKVGGFDWYDIGSTALVRSQTNDGSWTIGGYAAEINTSFAVLFLCRSNLARDLSGKVQRDPTTAEMKNQGAAAATDLLPGRPAAPVATPAPVLELPNPTGDEAIALASKLLKSSGADWKKLLNSTRDAKGTTNTRALVVLANNTDGDQKKEVREALAERLCRMTADTLRAMLKANEGELRRAAALACAMKDDKDHIPDLVAAMSDADDTVVRAARAGLKSLTGKDFSTGLEWREWLAKEKK